MSNISSVPALISNPARVVDGIMVYDREGYNEWFEAEYTNTTEPWEYSHRAAERYRHQYTIQQIRRYNPAPQTLLELGCSKGLMTAMLVPFSKVICAADISLTAIKACKQTCDTKAAAGNCRMAYFAATTPGLPFTSDSFDVVTVCDGLVGWWLSDEQRKLALEDIYRVLKKNGIAVLTDFIMPEGDRSNFEAYEAFIRNSPLSVVHTSYLYDRIWYGLESVLKKAKLDRTLRTVLANVPLAKMMNHIGHIGGAKMARHIVMVVQKE